MLKIGESREHCPIFPVGVKRLFSQGREQMKRFVYAVCVILIVLVLWVGLRKDSGQSSMTAPGGLGVSEATFAMRASGAQSDVTDFLVGRFADKDGIIFFFDGKGCVKRIGTNLDAVSGSYRLTESEDGAAILQLGFDEAQQLYSFRLTGPDGSFALTDGSGHTADLTPRP